jgi:hypothetical protein
VYYHLKAALMGIELVSILVRVLGSVKFRKKVVIGGKFGYTGSIKFHFPSKQTWVEVQTTDAKTVSYQADYNNGNRPEDSEI